MILLSRENINEIVFMLENDVLTDNGKDLLGQSLFYYCSGKDPAPIIAFGAKIPLYVYVDSFVTISNSFEVESKELYGRLKKANYSLAEKRNLKAIGRLKNAKNAELTLWENRDGNYFALLFAQCDANLGYEGIYKEKGNYIQPKYICNYRYETVNFELLGQVEKRVEYIMGHCFNPKYRCVGEYDYYGDYHFNSKCKIKLYRRHFYYLF